MSGRRICVRPRLSTRKLIELILGFVLAASAFHFRAFAVTPEDFGFGSLTVNGKPVRGGIPLLLVTFDLSTNNSARLPLRADANSVFDPLIFDLQGFPSVSGYFLENSLGNFFWLRAGVLGPVQLNPNETATLNAQQSADNGDGVVRYGLDCGAGIDYLLVMVD